MSITDELRDYAEGCYGGSRTRLKKIADRIDEVHKREVVKGLNEHQHGRDEGWDEAVELMEREYVHLPVDADGEPIRPGDKLTDGKQTYTVRCIEFNSCNAIVHGCTETNRNAWPIDQTSKMHHVKHPTVVEVLREMVVDWDCAPDGEDKDDVLKEYAEKLREVVEHDRG